MTVKGYLLLVLLTLSGCVVPPANRVNIDWTDPEQISVKVDVDYDDYQRLIHFTGPNYYSYREASVFLRSWRSFKSNEHHYQIYISDPYKANQWRFYDRAKGLETGELDLVLISRDAISCAAANCLFQEDVAINVTRDFLVHHQDRGFNFKLMGQGSEELFHVPGPYIQGFLMNMDGLEQRVEEELNAFVEALGKVASITGEESEPYKRLTHEYKQALRRKATRF